MYLKYTRSKQRVMRQMVVGISINNMYINKLNIHVAVSTQTYREEQINIVNERKSAVNIVFSAT